MSEAVLEVRDIEVSYHGSGLGVQGINLRVHRGQVVALLGANGAGKTTTLRAVSGFLPSDFAHVSRGSVVFAGKKLGRLPPHRRVDLGVSLVPERDKVFRSLTVEENLAVSTPRRRGRTEETDLVYDLFPSLAARRRTAAGFLSGGERQMLGIGKALVARPTLLLADEVSLGIAPKLVITMLDTLRKINAMQGTSILLVEQNAVAAMRISDYVYILENGRVAAHGSPEDLGARTDFASAYLGAASAPGPAGEPRRDAPERAVAWG